MKSALAVYLPAAGIMLLTEPTSAMSKLRSSTKAKGPPVSLPNIVVIMIDDLGWNQVGYHARPENDEIRTPSIDHYVKKGIEIDRGYMTPWCGPSRASFQTGTLAAFNEDTTQATWSFNGDTGFIGGLPPDLTTLPRALKSYAQSIGTDYATSYAGKWGLQGTTWKNTPMGAGYDSARSWPEHSMDGCDGMLSVGARGPAADGSGAIARSVPNYWDQSPATKSDLCPYFEGLEQLTEEEKKIACHSQPRVLPKLVDEDLLDYTTDIILTHDYKKKPLYHMISTQLMHTPLAYPSKYDDETISPKTPDYFKQGASKPPAKNSDMRLATANAMRFVDDIVNTTMNAIVDAGQWDNTIVLFTADNGGAIFPMNANNNYPLRGGKRSIFEGGYRSTQFLSGGWINPKSPGKSGEAQGKITQPENRKSDTFVFVPDWAPTLLQMAGGKDAVDHLYKKEYDTKTGAPIPSDPMEGNPMWEYIQNSVTDSSEIASPDHQLARKVSYSARQFYEVEQHKTLKFMHTPSFLSNYFIRKWTPKFPEDDDTIPDFGYISVMPCRPRGGEHPQECCLFDVKNDPEEDNPLIVEDDECNLSEPGSWPSQAADLYYGPENPPYSGVGKTCREYGTIGCGINDSYGGRLGPANQKIPSGIAKDQELYSLWSQYGAAGPWVSYDGTITESSKIVYPEMLCACEMIDPNIAQADVDAFIPTFQTPSVCISTTKTDQNFYNASFAVPCNGFQRVPSPYALDEYGGQGVNMDDMEKMAELERFGKFGGTSSLDPTMPFYRSIYTYIQRKNFTEWPALAKWPYITPRQDTCRQKKATAVPISVLDASPWFLNSGDGAAKFTNKDMCQPWNITHSWCPSASNPLQEPIQEFDPVGNYAIFPDGSIFEPINKTLCEKICGKNENTTVYIGSAPNGRMGMNPPLNYCDTQTTENRCNKVGTCEWIPHIGCLEGPCGVCKSTDGED